MPIKANSALSCSAFACSPWSAATTRSSSIAAATTVATIVAVVTIVAVAARALIAVAALSAFHQVEEWANAALGLWAVIAPWVLGFSAVTFATWAHVIAGLVVAVLAAVSLWFTTNRPLSTA